MVSALLVNWNTRDYLAECLASLPQGMAPLQYEVIVVDNASSDGSTEMVAALFPGVKLLAQSKNLGYAAANNLGAASSRGEHLLFLNPDTRLRPGSVPVLLQRLRSEPKAALVAPKLVLPDDTVQPSCRGFPTPCSLAAEALGLARLFPKSRLLGSYRMRWMDYEQPQKVPQPMATCWLVKREAWEQIGPFDEQYPIFFNDVDWCERAYTAGWEAWYEPGAVVEHVGGAATGQVRSKMIWESHRSLLRYYRSRLTGGVASPLYWSLALLIWTLALVRAKGWHAGFRTDH